MLKKEMIVKLNDQLNLEFFSSNLYLQMSAWCENNSFPGAAKFFRGHAAEEMQHMHRLFDYLCGTGAMPTLGAIAAPDSAYKSLLDIFNKTYEHEKFITSKINELIDYALTSKDYSSFNFLQWYVAEQHEEEMLFKSIIDQIELVGENGGALFLVDKELAGKAAG
ncbi:MAG: non-heme ferritin [Enterobacteriaceae bacterium]